MSSISYISRVGGPRPMPSAAHPAIHRMLGQVHLPSLNARVTTPPGWDTHGNYIGRPATPEPAASPSGRPRWVSPLMMTWTPDEVHTFSSADGAIGTSDEIRIEAAVEVDEPEYHITASPVPPICNTYFVDIISPRPQRLISITHPPHRFLSQDIEELTGETTILDDRVRDFGTPLTFTDNGSCIAIRSHGSTGASSVVDSTGGSSIIYMHTRVQEPTHTSHVPIPTVSLEVVTPDDIIPITLHDDDNAIVMINRHLNLARHAASPMPSSAGSELPGAPFPAPRVASPSLFSDSGFGSESLRSRDFAVLPAEEYISAARDATKVTVSASSTFETIRSLTRDSQEDTAAAVASWASSIPSLTHSASTGQTIDSLPTVLDFASCSTPMLDAGEQGIMREDKDAAGVIYKATDAAAALILTKAKAWAWKAIEGVKQLGLRAPASNKDASAVIV